MHLTIYTRQSLGMSANVALKHEHASHLDCWMELNMQQLEAAAVQHDCNFPKSDITQLTA